MIEEFMHMVSDPAHLAFEVFSTFVIDLVFLGLIWPFLKWALRRHDRTAHGVTKGRGRHRA